MTALMVAVGAAVGAPLRFLAGHWLDRHVHWGTLLVNLVGSFVLGALVGGDVNGEALALLGTGFCGGLTTYSTLALEIDLLMRAHRDGLAVTYGVVTVIAGFALAGLGIALGTWAHRRST
jgi:fluoride exporter